MTSESGDAEAEPVLLVTDVGSYRLLTLNRPAALNAWTPELGRALLRSVTDAAADDSVRAIVIAGAGRAFSAGADVKNPRELLPSGEMDLSTRLREIYNPIVLAIRAAAKPVVAAVQGAVAGLGVSLALACDLVLAAEDAYFVLAFVNIGVMPDACASTFLAERIGLARATELAMLGTRLPAAQALAWGAVNAVHPAEELMPAVHALATRLSRGPTVALASLKRSLTAATQSRLADQLEFEAALQQRHATTEDYAEGVRAFAEKRPTAFVGR